MDSSVDLGGSPEPLFQVQFQSGQYEGFDLTGRTFRFQVGIKQDILTTIPSSAGMITCNPLLQALPQQTTATRLEELANEVVNRVVSSNAYSIVQVSLQFDPKTIEVSGTWTSPASSLTTVPPGEGRARAALNAMKEHFGGLLQSDHGYYLGYSDQTRQKPLPLFAPTMINTSIRRFMSGSEASTKLSGLDALLFQLQTLDKSPPAGVRPNSFTSNVITDFIENTDPTVIHKKQGVLKENVKEQIHPNLTLSQTRHREAC